MKINRTVVINGKQRWIHANTEQEYCDKLQKIFLEDANTEHPFDKYALNWFETFSKPNIETATEVTYKRQIDLYLIPFFGDRAIESITIDDVQKFFNGINSSKASKQKIKTVLGMILDSAVDDDIISKSPIRSRRVKIKGSASKKTPEYTISQMRYLVSHLDDVKKNLDRMFLALMTLHPLRLEEALGLKGEDFDLQNNTIYICRAATHPTRNQAEVKETKTEESIRYLGLSSIAKRHLVFGASDQFIFGGSWPLSYQQVKRMCERIQADTGFEEKITPRRFRTTVLTDIYDQTKDVKAVQAAAGHTTSAMTLKYYVRDRNTPVSVAKALDQAYSEG